MKRKLNHPLGGRLKGVFCVALTAVLAAGVALNSAAADVAPVQYDVKVVSASTHTAALSNGILYLWGTNELGQFPESELIYSPEPVQLQTEIADVAVSVNRTLTVSTDGELRSYGLEPSNAKSGSSQDGLLLAKDAVQVDASDTFAAYVSKTGALYTWGQNEFGQLGNNSDKSAAAPVCIFKSGVKKVSLGGSFGLALMDDGTVYGWGSDSSLELGYQENGEPVDFVKAPVKITENAADVAAGYSHTCILKNDGSLWTCGDNTYSQTGVGGQDLISGLTRILTGIRSVSAGSQHSFAVSNDGAVYAWGYGQSGQLGSGNQTRASTPTETSFDYVQVFACDDNTFGVSSNGSIYSFGNNTNYLLGKTDGSDSMVPMRILDKDMNWVYEDSLDSGDDHYHGAEDPDNAAPSDPSDLPVESEDPEIVATPFVSGYEDGTFKPAKNVTRAEFLRMLVSALCSEFDPDKDYGTCSFSDVPLGKWYENYVAYAEREGLVRGYSDGTFRPDTAITRAEACVMVSQMFDGIPEEAPDSSFIDLDPNSAATAHINYLAASGIVNGDGDGRFRPRANITRAESITMVSAAAGYKPSTEEIKKLAEEFPASPFQDVPVSAWYYAYMLRAVGYVE